MVLDVRGFVDIIFTTCVAGYSIFESIQVFEQDFKDSKIQFKDQCKSFRDYINTVGAHDKFNGRLSEIYQTDNGRFCLIVSRVIRIAQLFADFG
jgi:hypothetical protein